MKKFITIDKIFYVSICFVCLANCYSTTITDYDVAYNTLINEELLAFFYIPLYLLLITNMMNIHMNSSILIRYVRINDWLLESYNYVLKVSFYLCFIFFIINYGLFCYVNKGAVTDMNLLVYLLGSSYFQFIGWIFIGSTSILLMCFIRKTTMAFLFYLCAILMIKTLKSELSMIMISKYIIPIWNVMLMPSSNISTHLSNRFLLSLIVILFSIAAFYLTKLVLTKKDLIRKGSYT